MSSQARFRVLRLVESHKSRKSNRIRVLLRNSKGLMSEFRACVGGVIFGCVVW